MPPSVPAGEQSSGTRNGADVLPLSARPVSRPRVKIPGPGRFHRFACSSQVPPRTIEKPILRGFDGGLDEPLAWVLGQLEAQPTEDLGLVCRIGVVQDACYVGELVNDRLELCLAHARAGRGPTHCGPAHAGKSGLLVQELIGEGNQVVARLRVVGKRTGAHPRMPEPTGRDCDVEQIWIFTLTDGLVTEIRAVSDRLSGY
jgi:SnoaL-like polyketide cyclase